MPVVIFNKNQEYDASWCDEIVSVMRPNVLGNPFPITARDVRASVIQRYAAWLDEAMRSDTPQRREIERLRLLHQEGRKIALICCCTPLPCHADVIKKAVTEDLKSRPDSNRDVLARALEKPRCS
jgi:hypothetical protein